MTMRERTTWDRNEIAKQAAGHAKKADPYTMNQPEHAKAQPAADAYATGTPSDFAEDVAPGTWDAEYSGGQVKRNEIGMPEFRADTFNHAEKTASEEVLVKKAALCVRVARCVLPKNASEEMVEDQALSFMHLPDAELISTYNRLAAEDDEKKQAEGEEQGQQSKQAQDDEKQAEGQAQEQQKQAQEQDKKQAEGQEQEAKQAGQMPPQFKENAEKKKEEAEAKKEEGQEKKAQGDLSQIAQAMQAMQQGDMKQAEQALQAAVQQMAQQLMQQMAGQQQQAPMAQQQQAPMAQQQQMAPTSEDQLLDQMLAEGQPQQQAPMAEDIELEAPSMDVGAESLDPVADAQLMQLFANQGEAQQAEQAKQASHGVRTASTRTVGARPSAGVSRLGGVVASSPASGGGRDLSSIWNSAPDVSDVFGVNK